MRRFPLSHAPLALLLVLTLAACGNKGPLVRAVDPDAIEPVEEVEDVEEVEVEEEVDIDVDAADEAAEDPVEDGEPVEVPPPPADPGNG